MENLENCENDEETMNRSEERLCKSVIGGLVKRNHEKHTMLADVGEKQEQDAICFDDIAGKELPWLEVPEARELELKYLCDLGVYQWTRNGLTQTKRSREPMHVRSRMCVREFKSGDRPVLYAGTPPLDALEQQYQSQRTTCYVRTSMQKAQRLVLGGHRCL